MKREVIDNQRLIRQTFRLPAWIAALSLTVLALVLSGCPYAYTPSTALMPQHIRRLAMRPVKNNTQFFGLEDKFTLRMQEEFTREGRYPLVAEDLADGVIIAEINRYINQPTSYDANLVVRERKLWVLVDIRFWDKIYNKIIWTETNLQGTHRYTVDSRPGGISEEEAREIVWDKLSRDILKRTIEGFGTVTGQPERQIPLSGPAGKKKIDVKGSIGQ